MRLSDHSGAGVDCAAAALRRHIPGHHQPRPDARVWDCLSAAHQSRLQGEEDAVFALDVPLWSRYRYLGQDDNIALFELTVNWRVDPKVYNPPVMHVIMAVYLAAAARWNTRRRRRRPRAWPPRGGR
ncbi:MAG: hypothetical protein E6I27_06330 [Chloroflexi bacterium]|nr:MAG: hypothetical protein E6I27_06330 [Chloroflexota bacterium]